MITSLLQDTKPAKPKRFARAKNALDIIIREGEEHLIERGNRFSAFFAPAELGTTVAMLLKKPYLAHQRLSERYTLTPRYDQREVGTVKVVEAITKKNGEMVWAILEFTKIYDEFKAYSTQNQSSLVEP